MRDILHVFSRVVLIFPRWRAAARFLRPPPPMAGNFMGKPMGRKVVLGWGEDLSDRHEPSA